MFNIPHITEHRAIKLFDEKFGKDKVTIFMKIREEFRELSDAFSEFIITGHDEHLRDEICDLQATVTHFASLFDLYQKQMLNTAIEKVKTRETDPGYKRYPNARNIRNVGIIGGIGSISPFESQLELLASEHGHNVVIIERGCNEEIFTGLDRIKNIEIELKNTYIEPLCKIDKCVDFAVEPKPWDRKEMNRHSKPSYKKKRRK